MIYNLVQYLRTKFPTEVFYANTHQLTSGQETIPDRRVLLTDTGGTDQLSTRYSEPTVQILARDNNSPGARELAYKIFNEIHNRFGLVLPSIMIGTIVFSEIQTAQIKAIQKPYCLGADENGRIEYTTNYKITFMED